jgi:hypothetical protein
MINNSFGTMAQENFVCCIDATLPGKTFAYIQFNCTDRLYMWYTQPMNKWSPVYKVATASDLAAQMYDPGNYRSASEKEL